MNSYLTTIIDGETLTREESRRYMGMILSGKEPPEQVTSFLEALRERTVDPAEILGFVEAFRENAILVPTTRTDLIDTCGTGGDHSGTFNISTAVSFVLAGSGIGVAKHGNYSISSQCGSADVLEALGIKTDLPPMKTAHSIDLFSFGFQLAPLYHPGLKHISAIRKALKVPTVFNILGPLINPCNVSRQLIGVNNKSLLETFSLVLKALGSEEVMVLHGDQGLDEIALSGPTQIMHLKAGCIEHKKIHPSEFGLKVAPLESIRGGSASENAKVIELILKGNEKGPKLDIVLLNSAAGFIVSGKAKDFNEGITLAKKIICSGKAFDVLSQVRRYSC